MNALRTKRSSVLAAWLALACFAVAGCDGNPIEMKELRGGAASPAKKELRELVLRDPPPEDQGDDLFAAGRYSQQEILARIAEVEEDDDVRGLFLQLGAFGGAWARSAELREALLAVRNAKKPVHCYFEETDNVGYALLASACDRITMTPTGILSLVGVHAEVVYARELLEMLGLRADLMQVGRYKGAADALTRSEMPEETRETIGALLDDLQHEVVSSVAQGRKLEATAVQAAIDVGPHTAPAAQRLRLVDAVAFDDEARARAKQAAKADRVVVIPVRVESESKSFFEVIKTLSGDEAESDATGKRIALAYLTGTIGNGDEESGGGANAGPFIKAMHRFADDGDVRAVVLRIDSPGGSALASDRMWHAVRRVAKRKPMIVSVGDMAASGGYYVACAAHEIFAEDASIIGSIGVVGGKVVFEDLAKRAGVHVAKLDRGKNAAWMSSTSSFSDSERAAMTQALEHTYETFLSRVAEGRRMTRDALAPMVEGRIMSSARARKGGLVDAAGGIEHALARAREKSGLGAAAPVEVWPKRRTFLERIAMALSGAEARALAARSVHGALALPGSLGLVEALLAGKTGAFAALPYSVTIH